MKLQAFIKDYLLYSSTPATDARAFRAYANASTAYWIPFLAVVIAVSHIIYWPTDQILLVGDRLVDAVHRVRLGSMPLTLGLAWALRYTSWGRVNAIVLTVGVYLATDLWMAWNLASAGPNGEPWFFSIWCGIPILVVVLLPFVWRVVISLLTAALWMLPFIFPYSGDSSLRPNASLILFTLFVVAFGICAGHATYHLLRETFFQGRRLEVERAESERLLLNVMPAPIASRLKKNENPIADSYPEATVMFIDISGFTAWSQTLPPQKLVAELNRIFTGFDALAQKHEIEKIKTIGDAYMVAAGLPYPREDHVHAVADMALDVIAFARKVKVSRADGLQIRVGINSGPVVAGVIGTHKFIYDLWGDTVNVASRMEVLAEPGSILVTETTRKALGEAYLLEVRGSIMVKGKGEMMTYVLNGRRES